MPLRLSKGILAFHIKQDALFLPYHVNATIAEGGRDSILAEAYSYEDVLRVKYTVSANDGDLREIAPQNILILAHGNRRAGFSTSGHAGDSARDIKITSAYGIAEALVKRRLHPAFSGNILVWTCFSGAAGGLADSIARALAARGLRQCDVYGAVGPTGSMSSLPDGHNDNLIALRVVTTRVTAGGALDAASTSRSVQRIGAWHGVLTYATADDVRQAQRRAGLRSAEI